jgi:hypothetical protein
MEEERIHVFDTIRHPKKRAFLMAFSQCGEQAKAATAAEVDRTTIWVWRKDDEVFAAAYEQAQEMAGDELEEVAISRAKAGSDTLLIFLLKGQKAEKYGDSIRWRKQVESMTDEQLREIINSGKGLAEAETPS